MRTGVISIHAEHADAIFDHRKDFEFRTKAPVIDGPTRFQVYVSTPVRALVGEIIVEEILEGSPESVWRKTRAKAGIDRKRFMSYFEGRDRAYALVVKERRRYGSSVGIEALREQMPGFTAPQFLKWLPAAFTVG